MAKNKKRKTKNNFLTLFRAQPVNKIYHKIDASSMYILNQSKKIQIEEFLSIQMTPDLSF